MRALITGINGFVGSYVAEHLLACGTYEVWGLARNPELNLASLRGRVQVVCADLVDRAAMSAALLTARPDVIFHLAGQPFVPESFRDPAATLAINTLGALHIFLTLIEHDLACRVLVVGTYEEYGKVEPGDIPIAEQTPLRPANPYGVSKVAQSLLAFQYHLSHQLDLVRVRPFNHIGPRQNDRFVTAAFARQIARIEAGLQPPIMQVGNLAARRDFTDVRDMARAYTLAAEHGAAGEVYNVGSGRAIAISELLAMLLKASRTAIEVRPDPTLMRPIDMPLVVCDAARLYACTGWQPQILLERTMADILDYWRGQC